MGSLCPCVTDLVVYSPTGLVTEERKISTVHRRNVALFTVLTQMAELFT